MFSTIDMFIVLCYTFFFSNVFIVFSFGPLFGYLSAVRYSYRHARVYLGYYIFKILLDLMVLYFSGSLFSIFTLFVNMFVCSAVNRWCRVLKGVTEGERGRLLRGDLSGTGEGEQVGRNNDPNLPGRVIIMRSQRGEVNL